MKYVVTGAAGFIGFHVSKRLLELGHEVVGVDNLNSYYDPQLKQDRLAQLAPHVGFSFVKLSLEDRAGVADFFATHTCERVIHLAAQAGVRYSVEHPEVYIDSNIVAFGNILEACRAYKIAHLVYASSSSVYGSNTRTPFSTHDGVDHPLSLYAATKRANELMAHTYSHLFGLPTTGLRFFTVYGPWGRPDMALQTFAHKMMRGEPIDVYNNGDMLRDWTYIDDIVTGVMKAADHIPQENSAWDASAADPATSRAPFRIYNLGGGQPVQLLTFIKALESALGVQAQLNFMPMQQGDVSATHADVTDIVHDFDFKPEVTVAEGIQHVAAWFKNYYA